MRPRLARLFLPLLILGGAVAVAAFLVATKPKTEPLAIKEKAWLVRALAVAPGDWAPTLTVYGRVESLWSTDLTAGLAAEVVGVYVIDGDDVGQGQVLARLDDREARLLLAQREAELAEAEARIAAEKRQHAADLEALPREQSLLALVRAEVERLDELVNKRAGAQSSLDVALQAVERQAISLASRQSAVETHPARLAELEARRARAEAVRDQAHLEVDRTRIEAPFAARVSRLLVAPGRRVRVGDPLVSLYAVEALILRSQIPSRYVREVREALAEGTALAVAGTIDSRPVEARLLRLAGAVAADTGGVEALFAVAGESAFLQQGRFLRLDLTLPTRPGLIALPPEAIYGTDRVYRIVTERLQSVPVDRIGETRDAAGASRVLVRAPALGPGDRVVVTQLPNAIEGLLVREAAP
jgi:multidrug efflux pump subunit AcrA (membrane-fusion protein)